MTPDVEPPEFLPPRTFHDALGVVWEVREIHSRAPDDKLAKLLGDRDRRRAGWLTFQSSTGEKRRASPVPEAWRLLPDSELEQCCMRAVRVPPAPARRQEDASS